MQQSEFSIPRQEIESFLKRERDDFYWLKDVPKELLLEQIQQEFPGFKFLTSPTKHQLVCFFIATIKNSFLFTLDMGGGKTKLALDIIRLRIHLNQIKRALVVVPTDINVAAWEDEVIKHSDLNFVPLLGTKDKRFKLLATKGGQVFVINYDGLMVMMTEFSKANKHGKRKRIFSQELVTSFLSMFQFIVFDEIHRIQSDDSLYFSLADRLCQKIDFRIGLTGTPMGKSPADLWSQYYLIDRGETLGEYKSLFLQTFCVEKQTKFGPKYTLKDGKEKELNRCLRHTSIRYKDKEFGDLPQIVKKVVRLNLTPLAEKALLEIMESGKKEDLSEDVIAYGSWFSSKEDEEKPDLKQKLEKLENFYSKLRQIASGFKYEFLEEEGEESISIRKRTVEHFGTPKTRMLVSMIQDLPEEDKVIVYYHFQETAVYIKECLKEADIPFVHFVKEQDGDRISKMRKFQNTPSCKVAIISINSGTEGLNLQCANIIFFFEPTDKIRSYLQAIKRIYRSGQTKRCYIYEFVTRLTVEERLKDCLEQATKIISSVVDGEVIEEKEELGLTRFQFLKKMCGFN